MISSGRHDKSFPMRRVIMGSTIVSVCISCEGSAIPFLTTLSLFFYLPLIKYRRWSFAQDAQQFLVNRPAASADLPKDVRLERRWIEHQITLYNCK